MELKEIIYKYGYENYVGRVFIKQYGCILVAKYFGLNWHKLSKNEKFFLKAEMIDVYAGTGHIDENKWFNLKFKNNEY